MLVCKEQARIIAYESENDKIMGFLNNLKPEEKMRGWYVEFIDPEKWDQIEYLAKYPKYD